MNTEAGRGSGLEDSSEAHLYYSTNTSDCLHMVRYQFAKSVSYVC